MKHLLLSVAAALSLTLPVRSQAPAPIAAPVPVPVPSPGEIVAASSASDWVAIAPADLLIMDLSPGADGKPRRVVMQLMPAPFSQGWIVNIRKLAAAHWWDGTSVNRVQDNYVVQWGDATEAKALPTGLAALSEDGYVTAGDAPNWRRWQSLLIPRGDVQRYTAFEQGWPIAAEGTPDSVRRWPVHCYGMVGVGRNMSPDTGSGAELYTVIGHAPRHLDRNIALVGRVIAGIEHLSSLPRGSGALGFYEDAAERVLIESIRLGSDLPTAEQPTFEYLSTDSDSFAHYADARANRRDPFFIRPAGGADICNIPVPVRAAR